MITLPFYLVAFMCYANYYIIIYRAYLYVPTVGNFGKLFFVFQGLVFSVVGHTEQPDPNFVCIRSFGKHYESKKQYIFFF